MQKVNYQKKLEGIIKKHEEKGDSEDPMTLYKNFRGTEPSMEPLLKNRGMK